MATVNGLNAKTLDYSQPGQGAAWVGANTNDVIARLNKLWPERTQKAGGSAEIYNNFQKWFNHDYEARMAKGWAATPTDKAIQNYFNTGVTTGIDPGYALLGFDKSVRGTAQHQQNKQPSFLEGIFTDVLPAIVLNTVGNMVVPGLGTALSVGYGGIKGGLDSGNIMGGLMGALQGYGAGQLGNGLGATFKASGGLSGLLNSPGSFFGNVGANFADEALGAFKGVGSFLSNPLGSLGNALSFGGSAANSPLIYPGATQATQAMLSSAAGGGGNMGFFDSLFGNGGLGQLVSGGLNYLGSSNAADELRKAAEAAKFQPYNINSPYGSASFFGNTATSTLSPEFEAALRQAGGVRGNAAADLLGFNKGGYANNYYGSIKSMTAPEDAWQANDFMDKVYSSGNMGSTTGAHDIFSYGLSKMLGDLGLRNEAMTLAGKEQSRLFDNYIKAMGNESNIAGIANQQISLGGNLGSQAQQGTQYPWQAAQNDADATTMFWSHLGDFAGKTINTLTSKYGTPGTNPMKTTQAINDIANWGYGNPFTGSGPLSAYMNA